MTSKTPDSEIELDELLKAFRIHQVPLAAALSVDEETPLAEVAKKMRDSKTGCVLTTKGSKIQGIFTDRDFLTKVLGSRLTWNEPVSQFATKSPVTMKSSELLRKALYLMRKRNFRHIPIMDAAGNVTGVLSIRNVVRLLAEHFPKEVLNLPPANSRVAETPEGG